MPEHNLSCTVKRKDEHSRPHVDQTAAGLLFYSSSTRMSSELTVSPCFTFNFLIWKSKYIILCHNDALTLAEGSLVWHNWYDTLEHFCSFWPYYTIQQYRFPMIWKSWNSMMWAFVLKFIVWQKNMNCQTPKIPVQLIDRSIDWNMK